VNRRSQTVVQLRCLKLNMFAKAQHCWQHYILFLLSVSLLHCNLFYLNIKIYRFYIKFVKYHLVVRQGKCLRTPGPDD
jgi:hypothetical protein